MVGLEGHVMAGTCIVVSGHRCWMFSRLGDRVMYLAPSTVAPGRGHEVMSQSCLGRSSERMCSGPEQGERKQKQLLVTV